MPRLGPHHANHRRRGHFRDLPGLLPRHFHHRLVRLPIRKSITRTPGKWKIPRPRKRCSNGSTIDQVVTHWDVHRSIKTPEVLSTSCAKDQSVSHISAAVRSRRSPSRLPSFTFPIYSTFAPYRCLSIDLPRPIKPYPPWHVTDRLVLAQWRQLLIPTRPAFATS